MSYWQLFWVTIGSTLGFSLLLILLLRGSKYSVRDTEAHSLDFGGVIKEGHGGMTSFLWIMFTGMVIWTIVYFAMHWSEFAVIAAYAR
jgi:hypothetical protein